MLLAGCSKDADISNSTTLSGNGEKTPLLINATLDTGKGLTRAVGETFAATDRLNVYIRHTTGPIAEGVYPTTTAGQAPLLVPIDVTSTGISPSLSPIYWDDYSDNTNAAKDLRTSGHGLQSYYAYCYNGGSPNSLTENTGVLTWTVQADQSTATALQHSDLLWSPEQTPVSYSHDNNNTNTFPVPFTHAMSQITVELTANAGYNSSGTPLALTSLLLKDMDIKTTLTAPTGGWDATHTDLEGTHIHDVTMCKGDYTTGLTRTYTAIVAPGTKLKKGEKLLDVTNADGNDYEVIITDAMLDDTEGWGKNHTGDKQGTEDGKKYIYTQPGNNYHLALSIDKSAVKVSATLENWSTVTSTGTGNIQFAHEEVDFLTPNSGFASTSAFSLFRVVNSNSYDTPEERTNGAYTYATVSTYDGSKWTNSPSIYWPNKDDSYYFRALANVSPGDDPTAVSPTLTTAARGEQASNEKLTSIALSDGGYILWGTTAAHSSYALGAAIPPRTGGVPMEFRVVNKCKVSFALETAASGDARVILDGASISISNIYESGTISIENGTVSVTGDPTTLSTTGGNNSIPVTEVLAQKISNNAVVTITLADNAGVYKINLNQCVESGGTTPITVWEGGHTYNYTIHVEKEDVKFSAVVKPWTTVSGSGTASLNW